MNPIQRKNLTESVAHWADNVEKHKQNLPYHTNSSSCACCKQCEHFTFAGNPYIVCFSDNQQPDALPCPIAEYTNKPDCNGTPWKTSAELNMPEIEHYWLSELLAGNEPPIFTSDLPNHNNPHSKTQARTEDPENQFWLDWYNTQLPQLAQLALRATTDTAEISKDIKVTYKQKDCYISDEALGIDFSMAAPTGAITPNIVVLDTSKIAGADDCLNRGWATALTIFEAKAVATLTFYSKVQAIILLREQHNTSLNLSKLVVERLAYLLSTGEL